MSGVGSAPKKQLKVSDAASICIHTLGEGKERWVESGRGQPHSKTLRENLRPRKFRMVLECGCPLPLLIARLAIAFKNLLQNGPSYSARIIRSLNFSNTRYPEYGRATAPAGKAEAAILSPRPPRGQSARSPIFGHGVSLR